MGWNDRYEGEVCKCGYPQSLCPNGCVEEEE